MSTGSGSFLTGSGQAQLGGLHHAAAAPDHPAQRGQRLGEAAPSKEGQGGGAPVGGCDQDV